MVQHDRGPDSRTRQHIAQSWGGAALRTMVLAVHADVDDPFVVVEAFSDVSAHAKRFGPIQFVHETVG